MQWNVNAGVVFPQKFFSGSCLLLPVVQPHRNGRIWSFIHALKIKPLFIYLNPMSYKAPFGFLLFIFFSSKLCFYSVLWGFLRCQSLRFGKWAGAVCCTKESIVGKLNRTSPPVLFHCANTFPPQACLYREEKNWLNKWIKNPNRQINYPVSL